MRKIASLGATFLIGGALVTGAAPAQAQPIIECGTLIDPVCAAAARQLQNIEDELGRVPEYIQHAYDTAYALYNTADRTVRCVVFGQCT